MQKVPASHDFDRRIRAIHDHLFANANIRTNEGISQEIAKVLMTLNHYATEAKAHLTHCAADPPPLEKLTTTSTPGSADLREMFKTANSTLKRYPEGTALLFDSPSLAYIQTKLQDIDFASGERDWLGDAIEAIRSVSAKRLGGQFFTDQRVTELAVDLLEFNPEVGDDFVDICAGTGGFLLAAARHLLRNGMSRYVNSVTGVEIDSELARLANGNLASLGYSHSSVIVADSLAPPESLPPDARKLLTFDTHRCLASNPPFGTKITVKNPATLGQFDLAKRWRHSSNQWHKDDATSPTPPDVLFVERNLQLLEPGRGRVALVTPYQILSGPQSCYVREWILRHARIRAVVDLPADTFQPWTGTKTSLLVLERRARPLDKWLPDVDSDCPVFMSISSHIGHDRRGNPIHGTNGEILTDVVEIRQAWRHFRNGGNPSEVHADSYLVDPEQILRASGLRLNASYHAPANREVLSAVQSLARQQGWRLSTVGEETERIYFPNRFKRDYVNEGIAFLGGTQITQLVPTNVKFLAPESIKALDLTVEDGWVLVTRSGSTGTVSSVSSDMVGSALSEHVIRIVPKRKGLPGEYIEAYLRSSIGQALLAMGIFGSVIEEITPGDVASIPLAIPPRDLLLRISTDVARARLQRASAARLLQDSSAQIDHLMETIRRTPVT